MRALLTAEKLFPARVYANQFIPDTLARLLARSRRDSPMGRELLGMAYRAGLPVELSMLLGSPRVVVPENYCGYEHGDPRS